MHQLYAYLASLCFYEVHFWYSTCLCIASGSFKCVNVICYITENSFMFCNSNFHYLVLNLQQIVIKWLIILSNNISGSWLNNLVSQASPAEPRHLSNHRWNRNTEPLEVVSIVLLYLKHLNCFTLPFTRFLLIFNVQPSTSITCTNFVFE